MLHSYTVLVDMQCVIYSCTDSGCTFATCTINLEELAEAFREHSCLLVHTAFRL
jgi:hypothetical protein